MLRYNHLLGNSFYNYIDRLSLSKLFIPQLCEPYLIGLLFPQRNKENLIANANYIYHQGNKCHEEE